MSKYLHFLSNRKKKNQWESYNTENYKGCSLNRRHGLGDALPCSHEPQFLFLYVGLGHGPGACSAGEVGGSSACQNPQQNVTLIVGGRDAFCLVWLISVRVKPGFIGIAAAVQRALFPSGKVPQKGQCRAAQAQPCFCRTFLGCSGQGSTDK